MMLLSVSNIAWGSDDFPGYLRLLRGLGCDGVELAPSLLWEEPVDASPAQRREAASRIRDEGLRTAGFHSLLYTRRDLQVFGPLKVREEALEYLARLCGLCRDLGGETLVFGSPRNRSPHGLPAEQAMDGAAGFFRRAAASAEGSGVLLLIEPLGPDEADFITSSSEALELIRRVDHPAFRFHMDVKALISCCEDPVRVLSEAGSGGVKHIHVGDPGLTPPGSTGCDHAPFGAALAAAGYDRFVSIEMRRGPAEREQAIAESVAYVRRCYFSPSPVEAAG